MKSQSLGEGFLKFIKGKKFSTILADPPWQFQNRTGKMAPEHKRLSRYPTMNLQEIKDLPVEAIADERAHLYLWVPNTSIGHPAFLPASNLGISLLI